MSKMKIIFIFALLLTPFATYAAAEPTEFRCYCNYKWSEAVGFCNDSDILEVKLGESWEVEGVMPMKDDKTKYEKTTYPKPPGVFTDKEQCPKLLEKALSDGAICGTYGCKLEANYPSKGAGAGGNVVIQDNWEEFYDLKWLTDIGTPANPIKVTEGEMTLPIEIIAGASTNKQVKIECMNCTDFGVEFKSEPGSGKGKATIVWDTSKNDLNTQIYVINVKAGVEGASWVLLGGVNFSVTGITPVQTTSTIDAWIKSQYEDEAILKDYKGALPKCAFSGTCRSINDLLQLIINFASGMFVILGSFAFAFFVYGGFKMIVSMGNAEMVETGKKTMIAAALGLVVAMVAYTAIDLMLEILNVSPEFRGIK